MTCNHIITLAALLSLQLACSDDTTAGAAGSRSVAGGAGGQIAAGGAGAGGQRAWLALPELPEAISNNAVAAVSQNGECTLISGYGIDQSRKREGIHGRVYRLDAGDASWRLLSGPGATPGRIAASAVTIAGKVYLLGGYSVGAGLSETSHEELDIYDVAADLWSKGASLPIAIDDAVALPYQDRYIVVVSGWGNAQAALDAVQFYDSETDSWSAGTPFPGVAVFGHAGAIDGDDLIVSDGVGNSFELISQTWHGRLDANAIGTIAWTALPNHPGPARYRAAAASVSGKFYFHGGSSVPYNFDGLAYSGGQPAPPLADSWSYDFAAQSFAQKALVDKTAPSMDHRGMLHCEGSFFTVGGMLAGPEVTADVSTISAP